MGEDTGSGLVFADDLCGYQEHPKGCRNEKALEYTRKLMEGDGDRKEGAVVVCNDDMVNPVKIS